MNNDLISNHYAKLLIKVADQFDLQNIVSRDLKALNTKIKSFKSQKFLLSYTVPKRIKHKFIESLLSEVKIHRITSRFLYTLIENNRFPLIYNIIKCYNDLLLVNDGFQFAEVETAIPLTKISCSDIESFIATYTNAKPIVTYTERKDLLGGITIKINNKIIDLSLRGKLKKIGNLLLETSINKQGF